MASMCYATINTKRHPNRGCSFYWSFGIREELLDQFAILGAGQKHLIIQPQQISDIISVLRERAKRDEGSSSIPYLVM